MQKKMNMINIVPVYPGNEDFTLSEIRRQARETGLRKFALSLSFHPEGTPAEDKIGKLCAVFRKIREGLASEKDLELGALIQSTQGHGWNGKVPLTGETWQKIVGRDGTESPRMCPLDPAFRAYVCRAIREVAASGARFLLIDDDFGLRSNECFCPLHIADFNQAAGKNLSLPEIRTLMEEASPEDPLVRLFSLRRLKTIVAFAEEIRKAIDEANPKLRCGFCTPYAGYGFVTEVAHALAGPDTEPFVRINNAIYGMTSQFNFPVITQNTLQVAHQLRGVRDILDESDTFPQNYYSESALTFHSHITCAVLNGLNGCKLWTSEFNNPVDTQSQKRYENILAQYGAFYDELLHTVDSIAEWKGVKGLLFRPDSEKLHPFLGTGLLTPPEWCASLLAFFGFPIHYDVPGNGGIYALSGSEVRWMSNAELETLLSGSVLIDAAAAKQLSARGLAPLMGVDASDGDEKFHFTHERHLASELNASMMWEPGCACLKPLSKDVRTITGFFWSPNRLSPAEFIAPGMTFFENSRGGRVVVTGWNPGMPFYKTFRPIRKIWIQEALDFLSGKTFDMGIEADQQVLVRHARLRDGAELLAVLNLALDPLPEVPVRIPDADPAGIERLEADGSWSRIDSFRRDGAILFIPCPMECVTPLIFRFRFA